MIHFGVVIAAWSSLRYFFAYAEVTRPERRVESECALGVAAIASRTFAMTRVVRRLGVNL